MLFLKRKTVIEAKNDEAFGLIPPETRYLSTRYLVKIPVTDKHLKDRWELRKHAAKLVERSLGDEVQVTSMKVKKPHLIRKNLAKLRGQEPYARAFVTVKF